MNCYLIIQDSGEDNTRIWSILGIYDDFNTSIYHMMRYNLLDKINEIKEGISELCFDIYIQEMKMNTNKLENTYILADPKPGIIKNSDLKLYIENENSTNIKELSEQQSKIFKKITKHSQIMKLINIYNDKLNDKLNKVNTKSKPKEENKELYRKYEADKKAFIEIKLDHRRIPIPEFNNMTLKQLNNLTFDNYKSIQQKNNFVEFRNLN